MGRTKKIKVVNGYGITAFEDKVNASITALESAGNEVIDVKFTTSGDGWYTAMLIYRPKAKRQAGIV